MKKDVRRVASLILVVSISLSLCACSTSTTEVSQKVVTEPTAPVETTEAETISETKVEVTEVETAPVSVEETVDFTTINNYTQLMEVAVSKDAAKDINESKLYEVVKPWATFDMGSPMSTIILYPAGGGEELTAITTDTRLDALNQLPFTALVEADLQELTAEDKELIAVQSIKAGYLMVLGFTALATNLSESDEAEEGAGDVTVETEASAELDELTKQAEELTLELNDSETVDEIATVIYKIVKLMGTEEDEATIKEELVKEIDSMIESMGDSYRKAENVRVFTADKKEIAIDALSSIVTQWADNGEAESEAAQQKANSDEYNKYLYMAAEVDCEFNSVLDVEDILKVRSDSGYYTLKCEDSFSIDIGNKSDKYYYISVLEKDGEGIQKRQFYLFPETKIYTPFGESLYPGDDTLFSITEVEFGDEILEQMKPYISLSEYKDGETIDITYHNGLYNDTDKDVIIIYSGEYNEDVPESERQFELKAGTATALTYYTSEATSITYKSK